MADDSGIDPRYAAQFQRGYDPARHRAAPPSAPTVDTGPPRLPGGPVAHAERVPDRPEPRRIPVPNASVAVDAGEETVEEGEPERRRFRVEWVLPIAAVALLVAAGVVYQSAQDAFGSGASTSYVLFLTGASIPGPLVAAAVICLTAWIMMRALREGPR